MASKKDVRGISRSALPALAAYNWPGNVRELENIIERSVALATHPVLQMEPIELALHENGPGRGDRDPSSGIGLLGGQCLRMKRAFSCRRAAARCAKKAR